MKLSRRAFLLGTASAAAMAVAPPTAIVAAPALDASAAAPLQAFAVGTPGEFDWQAIRAANPQEAFRQWVIDHLGLELDDVDAPAFDPDFVNRVEFWDDLPEINPADWFDVGFGHCCERCGHESHADNGARVVAGEVVCEDCLTLSDRVLIDPNDVVEDLGNRIADEGADDVRAWLERRGSWEKLPDELWQRAIAFASDETA